MFDLESIRIAHAKVRSGADFPAYVRELAAMGVRSYSFHVPDGHAAYRGTDGFELVSGAKYPSLKIAESGDCEALRAYLSAHQAGESDFLTACRQFAQAGTDHWIVDLENMRCIYYDRAGKKLLVEEILA
jgi:uncharacterized protein YbcV (DUF1398 family)